MKAHTKLTKSQKRKASELREYVNFLERIAKDKTPAFKLMGEHYWGVTYIATLAEYKSLYPGRTDRELVDSLEIQ